MTTEINSHSRHTVLIVDDQPRILDALRGLLEKDGHDVLTALSGDEALGAVELATPCIVLTDVAMPGMDGYTLCRRLKQNPHTADIPVVMVTGMIRDEDIEAGISAGAVDYIKKPFDRDEIRMRVLNQIRLHEATRQNKALQKQLSVISSAAKDAILIMDSDGCIIHWNEAAETLFGYPRQEALGKNLHKLIAPTRFHGDHSKAFPAFRNSGQGAAVGKTMEIQAQRKNGQEVPVELSLSAAQIDGKWCAVGIIRDVSDRQEREQLLKSIINNSGAVVYVKDVDGTYLLINRCYEQLFGVNSIQVLGKTDYDIFSVQTADMLRANDKKAIDGGKTLEIEEQMPHEDGVHIYISAKFPIRDLAGTIIAVGCVSSDTTQRKAMEVELGHARKLEAVGQLAAGIAHEINTPAQFVGDSMHFIREASEDLWALHQNYRLAVAALGLHSGHEELLQQISEAEETADLEYLKKHVPGSFDRCFEGLSRISSLVGAMKEFAHPDQREMSPADINQALQATLTIAKNEYKYVADAELELGDVPPVVCFLGDLNQVFLNLIVNAAHAIGDVVGVTDRRGLIRVRTRLEGETVCIEIEDTGSGVPEHVRSRIFEPFFTTKDVGKGSGQGLAIAHSIVEDKHKGSLTFRSVEGEGTTFIIRLPVEGACSKRAEAAA